MNKPGFLEESHDSDYLCSVAIITLVPTPVGNLEDMSFRAVRALQEADIIAAEDTRTSSVLLKQYQINTHMVSLHAHNEHSRVQELLKRVESEDLNLAVISDAGTPGISDPGYLIVREALRMGIEVTTLPGPTAFVPALVSSGIPCDRFVFEGFLPVKKGRQTRLKELTPETRTIVLYESPHRLNRTLKDLEETLGGERKICVSREISKKFETHHRMTLSEACIYFEQHPAKGELVLILEGNEK
jgi:16S rRNA (cytidine1402-2'-O)-methyltransferase